MISDLFQNNESIVNMVSGIQGFTKIQELERGQNSEESVGHEW